MWVLKSSGASPYGRKVRIGAALCGLAEQLRVEDTDTNDPADPIRRENPLGKIPALIRDKESTLYDSRVILEFLDWQAGGGVIIPPPGPQRFEALVGQALADGILDAALLQVYEGRFRPAEQQSARWLAHQADKVERALSVLETAPPPLGDPPHVGQIALACALGYLDLRFRGEWRGGKPALADWLDGFAASVPSFEATRVT